MREVFLFDKEYSEEELNGLERDVLESFNPILNPEAEYLPKDTSKGVFVVNILYTERKVYE